MGSAAPLTVLEPYIEQPIDEGESASTIVTCASRGVVCVHGGGTFVTVFDAEDDGESDEEEEEGEEYS